MMLGADAVFARMPQLGERHRSSGLSSRIIDAHLPFSEYIKRARNLIAQARVDYSPDELDKIVDGNAPFELKPVEGYQPGKNKPYRRGILLTHGLTDSPYFMRHLGTFFQENGFRVMAVLLPGHGTRPGDLLDVTWQDWAQVVDYGVEQLVQEVDEVYLGGYSAGATLSIYHSMRDQRVRGLFLFAPALKVSSKAAFANFHKIYSRWLPAKKWVSIKPDVDIYKYESFPKNAAAQMYALTRVLRGAKGNVSVPIFAVVSQDDATVDTPTTVEFMTQASHPANHLVYYFSDATKIPAVVVQGKIECVNSVFPEKNIISSAHTAIVLPDVDEHYGERGEYRNFSSYSFDEMRRYAEQKLELALQGEVTERNLKAGLIRRLMYNPNYAALKTSMRQFIAGLPV